MKRVLIITYYFPPSGGPGVIRPLKFVKYLPTFDWEPFVLTVRQTADFPARDTSLFDEIPGNMPVFRTGIFEPYAIYRKITGMKKEEPIDIPNLGGVSRGLGDRLAQVIRASFFIPDARIGWLPFGVWKGIHLIKKADIDLIFTTSPPYTVSLIGYFLKRLLGKPWVADFRDPWTGIFSAPKRPLLARAIDHYYEALVCRYADRITIAWEGIGRDLFEKHRSIKKSKIHMITNGYDTDDMPESAAYIRNHNRFVITHAGSLYAKRYPGCFLEAVRLLMSELPDLENKLLVRMIGRIDQDIMNDLNRMLPAPCIDIIPYMEHKKTLEYLKSSDVLLLVTDDIPETQAKIPLKLFEYMGIQRPILALAQEGEVSRLVDSFGLGKVAHPANVIEIKNRLGDFYLDWKKNEPKEIVESNENTKSYQFRTLTSKLVHIFDELT